MITKNKIKHLQSLGKKKNRLEFNEFVIEGIKMVNELEQSIIKVKEIYTTNSSKVFPFSNLTEVKEKDLERISSLKSPNVALAVCEIPKIEFDLNSLNNQLTLVLDDIKDPGNLGTIIRIADWFGIKNIICSKESVDAYNPKVVQSTMGSIARVNVYYLDLIEFFNNSKMVPVYGAFMNGESVYECGKVEEGIVVIGNESRGVSAEVEKFISNKITIPSFGEAESLNVAVATGIICSHFRGKLK